ncbi:MAG: 3-phosphoshikimate 1-carboxyvinyltransferase [Oscillospiraceae bacterium]|jgi:3-phosphoshikimate 1-carboxyvinyltransferase|nr:3-phosphoshikimate 1-carboxyvinyltransferase [Oscillospiraceae bacterium]
MNITVTHRPSGEINIPPSKSILHRAIICASLAGDNLKNSFTSDDIAATTHCMNALTEGNATLDCGESGSTLRFLLPLALALGKSAVFTGRGRLLERPMTVFLDELRKHGAAIEQTASAINVSGTLNPGTYNLPGDVSSQFISGLLFALPLLEGDSTIRLTSVLQSATYVELTIDELKKSGIQLSKRGYGFIIPGGQSYAKRADYTVEGDYSQAAFFLVARAFGCDLTVKGLNPDSKQGDRAIVSIIERAQSGAIDVDASNIPDLVPPVAALLSLTDGVSRIYNAGRLRLKESDRLQTVAETLNTLGADINIDGDALIINGVKNFKGGTVTSHGDHRIAMMAAVAAIRADAPVTIEGAEAVAKSYPNFWNDFSQGGEQ